MSSLPIASELIARGAEVVYYAPAEYAPWFKTIGAEHRTIEIYEQHPASFWVDPLVSPLLRIYTHLVKQTATVLPQIVSLVVKEHADAIVYDGMCLWARFVKDLLCIPAITVRISFAATPDCNVFRESSDSIYAPTYGDASDRLRLIRDLNTSLKKDFGFQVPGAWSIFTHSGVLNLVQVPREIHPAADNFDNRFEFVGPFFVGPRPHYIAENMPTSIYLEGEEPLVYISFGTSELNTNLELYQICFEALGQRRVRVLMSYGANLDVRALGSIPANFQIASRLPQFSILKQVDLFISHGGWCSVMESLYQGTPMIMLPMMKEHQIIANLITGRKAAISFMPNQLTSIQLAEAVDQVLGSTDYQKNAATLGRIIGTSGGYLRAADLIQQQ